MRTIHMIHGIHTSRTSRRMANLQAPAALASGMRVIYHEYGHILGVETRWKNPGIAKRIAKECWDGDIIVGHSNGCAIALRMVRDCKVAASGLVLLNAALRDDVEFPAGPSFVHVYYNDDDGAVPWAERSIKLLTDPLWGDMGRDGYRGADARVRQWDCERTEGMPVLRGHSEIVNWPAAELWAKFWASRCAEEFTNTKGKP